MKSLILSESAFQLYPQQQPHIRFNKKLINEHRIVRGQRRHATILPELRSIRLYSVNNDNDDDHSSCVDTGNTMNHKMLQDTTREVTTTTTDDDDNRNKNSENRNDFDWDTFLDTPFFDPNTVLNDPTSPSLLKQFATLVQNEYETVELIVTGVIFVVLIIATQELLRIQVYGLDNYIPFTKGINPGNLF